MILVGDFIACTNRYGTKNASPNTNNISKRSASKVWTFLSVQSRYPCSKNRIPKSALVFILSIKTTRVLSPRIAQIETQKQMPRVWQLSSSLFDQRGSWQPSPLLSESSGPAGDLSQSRRPERLHFEIQIHSETKPNSLLPSLLLWILFTYPLHGKRRWRNVWKEGSRRTSS